jgi:transcriptional regulator with XRE-family HTH domain
VARRPKEVVVSKQQLGERLRALREAREMTQVQLADLLGTYPANISSIEHGTRGVTIHQVAKLATALQTSADELLGLDRVTPARGRPRGGALGSRLARLAALPRSKQRAVIEMLDAYLEKHTHIDH